MIAVSVSEHGALSHTPVIPKIAERTSVNPKRKTIPLNVEMIADDPASANYAQTECQFRYCGTAIPFLTVRSTAR